MFFVFSFLFFFFFRTLSDSVHVWSIHFCECVGPKLEGQASFKRLCASKKEASWIAEIVGSFLNIVNISSRLCNLFTVFPRDYDRS